MATFKIPKMMKALIKNEEKESYDYTEIPVPEPVGDEVLIRVDTVSICGSDIALYKWDNNARIIATVPFIPGHEAGGTVVKCGPEADMEIGAKVGVENHYYCEKCYLCDHGMREICINMGQFGHGRQTTHGGCSEYTIVRQKFLYKITKNLSSEEIALMEPCGVAHNGVERLRVEGEDVLVIGCGPIGLLAQSLAKTMGAKRVIGVDIEDWKLKLAKDMGTDIVINTRQKDIKQEIMKLTGGVGIGRICECSGNAMMLNTCFPYLRKGGRVVMIVNVLQEIMELTGGVGIGRICECSGNAMMLNTCFPYLRKGGRVVMIGLIKQPIHLDNPQPDLIFKCATIKTVHGRRIFHTWEKIEPMVASKQVDVTKTVSHRFPMSQFEEAFKVLFSGTACKIVMDPSK